MQYAKTAESRGKTAHVERIFGTMETAPNGVGSTGRGLTTTSVLRGHVMAGIHSIHVDHRSHQTAERIAGGAA